MNISLPYKMLIERDVSDKVNDFFLELGLGKRCVFVCTQNIRQTIADKIKHSMKDFDIDFIEPESTQKAYLEDIAKDVKSYDFVVGLGGGKSIDIAKYAAFLAGKEWVAFPTILSHDGVVSSRAILDDDGSWISVEAKEPIAVIADLDTIKNAPYEYIAAGAGDLISNISAVEDWRLAAKEGKEAYHTVMAKLSLLAAEAIEEHTDDIKARNDHGLEILLWSLLCAGFAMNIYGSSRPCSGSEHNISHALDRLNSGALHGEQVALGTIISVYLQKGDWKKIKDVLKKLGIPTTAKELNIGRQTIIKALVKARDVRDRYTILNKHEINEKKAEEILKKVEII